MVYLSDPIGDLLTRMRNAQHARRPACQAPWSKIKQQLCELLKKEGWIEEVEVIGEAPKQELLVTFSREKPTLTLERRSKPGRRLYVGFAELKPVLQGFGMAVLTTSDGLLTDRQARKRKMGGEILCTVS
ncbi:30S ribosomal protein S8 [Candidatus Peregrinibacteria bacterium]|nr:30S ribosomal protein S8 [Candidatus Peregrinibacteria bacterium]MBI3815937.1 30S ribosomal protein S8 [Candidatus Peregrinibacteria bacterium]